MSDSVLEIAEWQGASPETHPVLRGLTIAGEAAELAARLSAARLLEIVPTATGLSVRSRSWVGVLQLGTLRISIRPKIDPSTLLTLLRYAFRLPNRYSTTLHSADRMGIRDLLVSQLRDEAKRLLHRGLHRAYERHADKLPTLRGQLDFDAYVRHQGAATATLPCQYFERTEDTPINRVLLAGLQYAIGITETDALRVELRRLKSALDEQVTSVPLSEAFLRQGRRNLTRLTANYAPAFTLIELLYHGQYTLPIEGEAAVRVPGFLLDMNTFFQRILSRFLNENLPLPWRIADEHALHGMFRYAQDANPKGRHAPTPRPDFALYEGDRLRRFLDAKYIDLWGNRPESGILYQLALYGLAGPHGELVIALYPVPNDSPPDQILDLQDPRTGACLTQICLRAVPLKRLANAVLFDQSKGKEFALSMVNT